MHRAVWIVALLALAIPQTAPAQGYPDKPIRLIVGYTPGGGNDIAARLIAPKISEALGQPVIVENRPGAATNIAQELVSKSAPDGYTLLLASPAMAINRSLYGKLPFDALRDLVGVTTFAVSPNILVVNPSVPAKTVQELIALARANPGKYTYSSSGSGSSQHLAGVLFNLRTKTETLHVPYKGTAPSLTALIGGEVNLSYSNIPAVLAHLQSGRLRALASTGATRSELLPDVPTLKESGIDMEVIVWYGVMAPAGTPRPILNRLAEVIVKALQTPEIRKRLADLGAEPVGTTPDEFDRQFRAETAMWAEVVKASGAKAD